MVKLLLIGCGKMGGALLKRATGTVASHTYVIDPLALRDDLKGLPAIHWLPSPDKIEDTFKPDVVLIAIKPQYMAETLPSYRRYDKAVFLSIAAGQTMASIATWLGRTYAIVRAMPNLPASIGAGMSVAVANKNVSETQRNLCDQFLKAVGQVAWVNDESLIDAVTALSGSGPAYFYALTEAMTAAGKKLGLAETLAEQLARQTLIGSGALLAQSNESAENLRKAVTSPGGTTEAALKLLLAENGLNHLIEKAMITALQRAKELAK